MMMFRRRLITYKKYSSTVNKGFTLVELLVVIGVLGVLVAGILVAVNPKAQFEKVRNSQQKTDLTTLKKALNRYRTTIGEYPPTPNSGWCGEIGTHWVSRCRGEYIPNLVSAGEIKSLPSNPNLGKKIRCTTAQHSTYLYRSNGIDYKLLAHCSPEGESLDPNDPFFDPERPTRSWAVYTSGAEDW